MKNVLLTDPTSKMPFDHSCTQWQCNYTSSASADIQTCTILCVFINVFDAVYGVCPVVHYATAIAYIFFHISTTTKLQHHIADKTAISFLPLALSFFSPITTNKYTVQYSCAS